MELCSDLNYKPANNNAKDGHHFHSDIQENRLDKHCNLIKHDRRHMALWLQHAL